MVLFQNRTTLLNNSLLRPYVIKHSVHKAVMSRTMSPLHRYPKAVLENHTVIKFTDLMK